MPEVDFGIQAKRKTNFPIKEAGMKEAIQSVQGVPASQSTGNTIGMDLGDRWSRYCVLDGNGLVVETINRGSGGLEGLEGLEG